MVEDNIGLNACIDHHLIDNIIPKFRAQKLKNFQNIVKEMATAEINNNNLGT